MPEPEPIVPRVTIRYTRRFPYAPRQAYEWLTDYRDDDHLLAGAIVKRRDVVKKEGNVVHLDGELEALGYHGKGRAEVHLFPDSLRWEARFLEGSGRGSLYTYALTPTKDGCKLVVDYHMRAKRWKARLKLNLARPLIKRELDRMWDGFAKAMEREMGGVGDPGHASERKI